MRIGLEGDEILKCFDDQILVLWHGLLNSISNVYRNNYLKEKKYLGTYNRWSK